MKHQYISNFCVINRCNIVFDLLDFARSQAQSKRSLWLNICSFSGGQSVNFSRTCVLQCINLIIQAILKISSQSDCECYSLHAAKASGSMPRQYVSLKATRRSRRSRIRTVERLISIMKLAPEKSFLPMFLSGVKRKYAKAKTTNIPTIGPTNGRINPVQIP